MDSLLLYLLKVAAGTTLFYLSYLLLFRNETFYVRNRIFLILTLILPTILPFISLPVLSGNFPEAPSYSYMIHKIVVPSDSSQTTFSGPVNPFDYNRLFVWIYFIVAGYLLLRIIISITSTCLIIKKGTVENNQVPRLILTDKQLPPFSFFLYAVIPYKDYKSGNYSYILEHEAAHIRQGHTFDLLLSELLIAFQWFNPFIWLIKRSIVLNHEYLADNISLSKNKSPLEYQYRLLNFQNDPISISLAHNFNSSIKNRIVMINKKPTPKFAAWKTILILPVLAMALYAFARPENNYNISFEADHSKEIRGIVAQMDGNSSLFSDASTMEILKFLAENARYPQEAKNSLDTGKIFVSVKINKGGKVRETDTFIDKKEVKVPILNEEIVIIGYIPSEDNIKKSDSSGEHPELRSECLRLANKLEEIDVPEWNEKNMEFAVAIKFVLKHASPAHRVYNDPGSKEIINPNR